MSDTKKEILKHRNEIERIKSIIENRKRTIHSHKNSKSAVSERYKSQINRADKKDKSKLRDRKKHEIENYTKQIESIKRDINSYKEQISKQREYIARLKK
jgi:chromosome segregation ATPase